MKIWGMTEAGLDYALAATNDQYDGNIRFFEAPKPNGRALSVRLYTNDKDGPGQKFSRYSGRATRAATWEAHRDFMRHVFAVNPNARIKTALADYRGAEDFEDKYLATSEF
jgi:hypothetical protein